MKKVFTILYAVLALMISTHESKAGTYYVVNGVPFSLSPVEGSDAYAEYQWVIDPAETFKITKILAGATGGLLEHVFTDAIGTPKVHKISLGVLGVLDGCLSNVIEHTVIVLPKVTLTLSADKLNFCTDKPVDANLTAELSVVTGLAEFGVSIGAFTWKKGDETIADQDGSSLKVSEKGIYHASVTYNVPTDGAFKSDGAKLIDCAIPGTLEILNNLAVPLLPSITLK